MTNYKPWTVKEDISLSWQSTPATMAEWHGKFRELAMMLKDIERKGPRNFLPGDAQSMFNTFVEVLRKLRRKDVDDQPNI